MITMLVLITIAALVLLLLGSSVRVITQFERGVVLRFGQLRDATRGPGLTFLAPVADRLHKVNMQVVTMPVPAQEGITRDNVTVRVDAVVYYRVTDPVKVVVEVQNYDTAIAQVAQASLRSIIGKSDLDDLLSNRERLNQGLELMIDSPALGWGVQTRSRSTASWDPGCSAPGSWLPTRQTPSSRSGRCARAVIPPNRSPRHSTSGQRWSRRWCASWRPRRPRRRLSRRCSAVG